MLTYDRKTENASTYTYVCLCFSTDDSSLLRLQQERPELVGRAVSVRTPEWTYVHRLYEGDELYDRRVFEPGAFTATASLSSAARWRTTTRHGADEPRRRFRRAWPGPKQPRRRECRCRSQEGVPSPGPKGAPRQRWKHRGVPEAW